jgi:hypothetical protein
MPAAIALHGALWLTDHDGLPQPALLRKTETGGSWPPVFDVNIELSALRTIPTA